MRGISIILFIGFICAIVKIINLKRSNEQTKTELSNTIKTLRSEKIDSLERLTIYYLITLEQNKGLEKFQSSRNWKANNEKLNELQQKL